ncbi:hypothetical protein Lfu02_80020 [Longispora fulva]|uniref:Uncharacterized protein n=1 Tax=Longispora fulva TaxID=619741 RepID=A0A8J7GHA7_9ACTN|nr:hypothetical protein [Longispora fulva]MBG6140673.1 hypothetical protein [Longispora fulva]GIG63630.1 hypothetical protein Lfu02_80020 [Longispora fulva]
MSDTVTVKILRRVGQHQRGAIVEYDRASAEFLIAREVAEQLDEQPARAKRQPARTRTATEPTVTEGGE